MEEATSSKLNPYAPPFYPSNARHSTPVDDPPPPPATSSPDSTVRLAPVPTGPRSRGGKARPATTTRRTADCSGGGGVGHRDVGKRLFKRWPGYREIMPLKREENSTSVMIRNIPNNYTELLVEFLENHCRNENDQKDENTTARSAFDFVYLPVDFRHRLNAGYAFVNFTSSDAAWRFYESMKGKSWDLFESKKIAEVTRAKIQGKEALMRNFERMQLCSPSPEYLPVWFDPPVDGSGSSPTRRNMHTIGTVKT